MTLWDMIVLENQYIWGEDGVVHLLKTHLKVCKREKDILLSPISPLNNCNWFGHFG